MTTSNSETTYADKEAARRQIEDDVEAFLSRGGSVEVVASNRPTKFDHSFNNRRKKPKRRTK